MIIQCAVAIQNSCSARKNDLKLAFKGQLTTHRVWSGSQKTWIPAQFCHSPAVWPWTIYLTSLHLCVLFSKVVVDSMS